LILPTRSRLLRISDLKPQICNPFSSFLCRDDSCRGFAIPQRSTDRIT